MGMVGGLRGVCSLEAGFGWGMVGGLVGILGGAVLLSTLVGSLLLVRTCVLGVLPGLEARAGGLIGMKESWDGERACCRVY